MKFTNGPWNVHACDVMGYYFLKQAATKQVTSSEHKYNAFLMECAPELLQHCIKARALIVKLARQNELDKETKSILGDMSISISKAIGD